MCPPPYREGFLVLVGWSERDGFQPNFLVYPWKTHLQHLLQLCLYGKMTRFQTKLRCNHKNILHVHFLLSLVQWCTKHRSHRSHCKIKHLSVGQHGDYVTNNLCREFFHPFAQNNHPFRFLLKWLDFAGHISPNNCKFTLRIKMTHNVCSIQPNRLFFIFNVAHLHHFCSRGRGTSRHFPGQHSSQYRREEIHICRPTVLWEAEREKLVQWMEADAQFGTGIQGCCYHEKTQSRSAVLDSAKKIIQSYDHWSNTTILQINTLCLSIIISEDINLSSKSSFESDRQ